MSNKFILFPILGVLLPIFLFTFFAQFKNSATLTLSQIGDVTTVTKLPLGTEKRSERILFVGDVLLARHVEFLINQKGLQYPYKKINDFLLTAPIIFGNFESAILSRHVTTPSYVTTFATNKLFLPSLKKAGFTHLSLANNHTFDYGEAGYATAWSELTNAGFKPFGHPTRVDETSITTFTSGSYTVGVLALNQVFVPIDTTLLLQQVQTMASTSDYQIAYIHWGNEYNLKHNLTQEKLAHALIDAGIDAVIGHHPHVTQDIEIYNGKPIFYSLGNFIFDQYFSVDVQQGLALSLELGSSSAEFILAPISSEGSKAQPYEMELPERQLFLTNLARRSTPDFIESIKAGKLILPLSLATSSQNSIIAP